MRIWIALFPALVIGCSSPYDDGMAVIDDAGEDQEVLTSTATKDELEESEEAAPIEHQHLNGDRLKSADSNRDSVSIQFIGPEAVPLAWFEGQCEYIKSKILNLDLRLWIVDGEARVGVVDRDGEWLTWPGSRSLGSGGSSPYIFHNPNPGVPIRF